MYVFRSFPTTFFSEKCGEKSLITLENIVRSYKIEYKCENSPDELIFIMCSGNWQARECQYARQILRTEWNKKINGNANSRFPSITFLSLLSIIINYFL